MSMQGGKPQYRSTWSNYTSTSQLDNSLIHRSLFSERVDIFSSVVEFSKVSILTGIIKISLKTLLECVVLKNISTYEAHSKTVEFFLLLQRLKTFSKYGLQQIQVDAHYLQMNLWRFVSDEK